MFELYGDVEVFKEEDLLPGTGHPQIVLGGRGACPLLSIHRMWISLTCCQYLWLHQLLKSLPIA